MCHLLHRCSNIQDHVRHDSPTESHLARSFSAFWTKPHPQPTREIPSSSGDRDAVNTGIESNPYCSNSRAAVDFLGGEIAAPFLFGSKNPRKRGQWAFACKLRRSSRSVACPLEEDDEMRSRVGPLHNASSKVNPRKEVLEALASALAITVLMGLALLILSLLLASQ